METPNTILECSSKYSVLMSLYYKENPKYFIQSIESMINQTQKPDEIVIVKDGLLTEDLEQVINVYKNKLGNNLKIIPLEKNMGFGLALAEGIKNCSNEFIARMDTDDISVLTRCEEQIKYMKNNPQVGMVGCIVDEFVDVTSNVVAHRILPENHNEIIQFSKKRVPIAHPSVIYRKSDVLACGNYRHRYLVEDYDLFVRLLKHGVQAYNIQKPLVYMRVSDDFFMRRGGIHYLKSLLKFNIELYEMRWFSIKDFLIRSSANVCVCLMPNRLRDLFYKKILRKTKKNGYSKILIKY